jgi:ribose transport system permease protein
MPLRNVKTAGASKRPARPPQVLSNTRTAQHYRVNVSGVLRRYGLILAWAIVIVIFSAFRPNTFLTSGNFDTIFGSQAVLVILTLGLIVPFTVGEFDVSIAGICSVSLVIVGWTNVIYGWPIGWSIGLALASGIFMGLVNAFFVVVVEVDSIVVTLGTGTLLTGIGVGINSQTTGGISQALINGMSDPLFGVPLDFYYGLALTVVMWYVWTFTPLGRHLYLVGASREMARLSGLKINALRTGAFVASGLMGAAAGVMLAGWIGASDASVSAAYLLPAFSGLFLGATAFTPGRFNPWGSFIAVYFLVTGITGLELLGYAGWVEQVFYGASLVLAVSFTRLTGKRLRSSLRS